MSQIIMPQVGQAMEEGTIVCWHKAEGDAVAKGDILFEIETYKSVIEVEASASGVLRQILVPAGQAAAAQTPVAVLDPLGESSAPQAAPPAGTPETGNGSAKAESDPPASGVKPVLMPMAGQTMEEGLLVKWHVKPGDVIKKGDVIFEIETEKSVIEVESAEAGRLARIVVGEGAVVPVLRPVAYLAKRDADVDAFLAAGGDSVGVTPASAEAAPAKAEPAKPAEAVAGNGGCRRDAGATNGEFRRDAGATDGRRIKASPAARKLAAERGLDLAAVGQGSGPQGRILSADVVVATPVHPAPVHGAAQRDTGKSGAVPGGVPNCRAAVGISRA